MIKYTSGTGENTSVVLFKASNSKMSTGAKKYGVGFFFGLEIRGGSGGECKHDRVRIILFLAIRQALVRRHQQTIHDCDWVRGADGRVQ